MERGGCVAGGRGGAHGQMGEVWRRGRWMAEGRGDGGMAWGRPDMARPGGARSTASGRPILQRGRLDGSPEPSFGGAGACDGTEYGLFVCKNVVQSNCRRLAHSPHCFLFVIQALRPGVYGHATLAQNVQRLLMDHALHAVEAQLYSREREDRLMWGLPQQLISVAPPQTWVSGPQSCFALLSPFPVALARGGWVGEDAGLCAAVVVLSADFFLCPTHFRDAFFLS